MSTGTGDAGLEKGRRRTTGGSRVGAVERGRGISPRGGKHCCAGRGGRYHWIWTGFSSIEFMMTRLRAAGKGDRMVEERESKSFKEGRNSPEGVLRNELGPPRCAKLYFFSNFSARADPRSTAEDSLASPLRPFSPGPPWRCWQPVFLCIHCFCKPQPFSKLSRRRAKSPEECQRESASGAPPPSAACVGVLLRVPVPTCPDALRDSPLLFPVSDTNNTNPRSEFDAGLAKAAILSPRTPCVGTARAAVAAAFNHRQGAWTQLDLPGLIAQDGDRIAPSKASYRALGQSTSIPCVLPDPTLPLDSGSDPPSCVFSAQPLITLRYVTVFSLPGDNV